jgi:lambda family phage minor tail protein L
MKTISDSFAAKKNAQSNQPIFLYTIHDYDGASHNLCYAEYDTNITFDGVTYTKCPITHESVSENSRGEVDTVKVSISNVDRAVEAYLASYSFKKKKVTIRKVWADSLADATAYVDDIYYIDSYSTNDKTADFSLSSKYDVLDVVLPKRVYLRNYCSWKFTPTTAWATSTVYAVGALVNSSSFSYRCLIAHTSGTFATDLAAGKWQATECGYAGAETTCNKTFQRCRELANQRRFGGFPSIPAERNYAG